MTGLWQDLIFAARMLVKDRRFTFAAVLALALAVGVNSAVFTIVNTALLRDLPFADPDRLVSLNVPSQRGPSGMSLADARDLQRDATAFSGLSISSGHLPLTISEPDLAPERLRGAYVSSTAFAVLGVTPILGREFRADDDRVGAAPVVLLGHAAWERRYRADPSVVGRTVRINGTPAMVIGVMPPGFKYPAIAEAWQPLALAPGVNESHRDVRSFSVVGRLRQDVGIEQARAEVTEVASRLAREFPDTNSAATMAVEPMREGYGASTGPLLWMFLGAVGLVLLIACANVANLLLARAATRAREVAIRAALGAPRWRIVRQLLVECLLIAVLGGVGGTLLSIYGAQVLAVGFDAIEPGAPAGSTRPFYVDLSMDGTIYAFIGALCAFSTIACGLVPALLVSRPDVQDLLRDGERGGTGRRARRWTSAFLIAELALSLILLSGTGMLWRSFLSKYAADTVIDPAPLVTMRFALPLDTYASGAARKGFMDRLDERLQSIRGIESAALVSEAPFGMGVPERQLEVDVRAADPARPMPAVSYVEAGPRYFETVQLPLLRGRALTAADARAGQEAVVVDEWFASSFLGDGNPIGRRIRLTQPRRPDAWAPWMTVVGIARTLPLSGPRPLQRPIVYGPLAANPAPDGAASIVVRDEGGLARVTPLLREDVRRLDPDVPLFAIESLDAAVARQRLPVRWAGTWFAGIAAIALVLATVGLYSLTAHGVAERTREIGVRMALGARPQQVLWLFLRRVAVQLAIGLSLGLVGAIATTSLLQTWLDGINPRDPLTLAVVVVGLVTVALTASLIPARRATRVDPATALRAE